MNTLHIEINTLEDSLDKFKETWKLADGDKRLLPHHSISFDSIGRLLSSLTPKRWELIEHLKSYGQTSIYALANSLGRDYKNVHTDVCVLKNIGIIDESDSGISITYDEILVKLKLAA